LPKSETLAKLKINYELLIVNYYEDIKIWWKITCQ